MRYSANELLPVRCVGAIPQHRLSSFSMARPCLPHSSIPLSLQSILLITEISIGKPYLWFYSYSIIDWAYSTNDEESGICGSGSLISLHEIYIGRTSESKNLESRVSALRLPEKDGWHDMLHRSSTASPPMLLELFYPAPTALDGFNPFSLNTHTSLDLKPRTESRSQILPRLTIFVPILLNGKVMRAKPFVIHPLHHRRHWMQISSATTNQYASVSHCCLTSKDDDEVNVNI